MAQVRVATDCATAFQIFVDDIDLWWRRGGRYRSGPTDSVLRFEPGPQGALIEEWGDGCRHELGRVLAWQPPFRILLRWRLTNYAPDEATEVEVRFAAEGAETRIQVEHRGLDRLRPDHPARHGLSDHLFLVTKGRWWREVLGSLKERLDAERPL
jgi:uncharacterized protein YndB with AHSA1/START domain